MKKILMATLILLACGIVNAQEALTYSKVIQADSLDKTSIYVALRAWFSEMYNSSNKVIQMDDKDAGIIIGKGTTPYSHGGLSYLCYEGWVNYTVKVQIRDGRYKAELSNINHENKRGNAESCNLGLITTAEEYATKGMSKKFHNKVANDIKEKMKKYAEELFSSMEVATTAAGKASLNEEEW
jgi:hypothetical protein